jgi:hypothetical protein
LLLAFALSSLAAKSTAGSSSWCLEITRSSATKAASTAWTTQTAFVASTTATFLLLLMLASAEASRALLLLRRHLLMWQSTAASKGTTECIGAGLLWHASEAAAET